jgi:hypothetical protein
MPRPRKKVNATIVERLAGIGCTMIEIGAVCGCSVDVLERRFKAVIEKGRDTAKASLRRMQWEKANEGHIAMLIWLGKQLLGQREIVISDVTSAGRSLAGPDLTRLSPALKKAVIGELGGPPDDGADAVPGKG